MIWHRAILVQSYSRLASRLTVFWHRVPSNVLPWRSKFLSTAKWLCYPQQESTMLHYAVIFFVIALIAALFGFGGIASGAAGIAQILFVVFLVLAIATFIFNLLRGKT
jgi:uncharacterized membrane protein YtjA (UPF0391 family)